MLGQLGNGRRLARPVDADDEQHERLGRQLLTVVPVPDGGVGRVEQNGHLLLEHLDHAFGARYGLAAGTLAYSLHQLERRFDAHIGGDERILKPLPQGVVIQCRTVDERTHGAAESTARARECVAGVVLTAE